MFIVTMPCCVPSTCDGYTLRKKKGLLDLKALAKASALAFPSSIADSLAPLAGIKAKIKSRTNLKVRRRLLGM